MKNASMTIILILALTISLMSIVIFNGIQQARAEAGKIQQDNKTQVNTPKQQINNCIKNTPYKNLDCNNVLVYGVVCMPGSICKLERFDIPFDLVTPY
jgi:short subunit fatty acids transporter